MITAAKIFLFLCPLLLTCLPARACLTCNRPLQAAILEEQFWELSFFMLLPFLVVGLIVIRLYKLK
jgi:hypothetical protein